MSTAWIALAALDLVGMLRAVTPVLAQAETDIGHLVALFPIAASLIWTLSALLYSTVREPLLPGDAEISPEVTIVVPAHNEELVIGGTIESLLAQDYPGARILVVNDGSRDGTAQIVRSYGSRGVVLLDLECNQGKAKGLQRALDRCTTPLFMIVDADTTAAPGAVRAMVRQFVDPGIAAVTGAPAARAPTTILEKLQALEYACVISLLKRATALWGGLSTVSGAAACFRTETLRRAGGWSDRSATEDIEISWRLQRLGFAITYEPRALFEVQVPRSLSALRRQRERWSRGLVQVLRMHGNLLQFGNPVLVPIMLMLVLASAWLPLLLADALMFVVARLGAMLTDLPAPSSEGLIAVAAASSAFFLLQALIGCVLDGHYRRGMLHLVLLAPLYPAYFWLVIVPSFVRGTISGLRSAAADGRWHRTARTPCAVRADVSTQPPES